MTAASPPLLTLREACAQLRASESTVRRWVRDGILPAVRVGRCSLRFRPADLAAAQRPAAAPRPSAAAPVGR